MSVESAVISHIVHNGDESLIYLIEQGITVEHFTEERTHDAYQWILDEWGKYDRAPSAEKFDRRFVNFKHVHGGDPIASLAEELRNHYAKAIAAEMMPLIATELAKPIAKFKLPVVTGMMSELQERISIVGSANQVALLGEQIERYVEELLAMEGGEVPGITTGFDTLDMASGGWQTENFGVIGAAPKRFKTAVLMWMVLAAARAGHLAKVVTFEMSIKELMDRITCLGAHVSYTNILRGNLTDREKRKVSEFAKDMAEWDGDIEIVHDVSAATTLAGFTAQVRNSKRRPDIIFIDGLYQMTDDSREWSNEAMALTAVSRGLARFTATEKIPVVGTSQALLSRVSRARGTEMGSLGYTSAFAQDANVIIGLDRPDMQSNEILLRVIGARAMSGMSINLVVDFDSGTIYEGGEVSFGGSYD